MIAPELFDVAGFALFIILLISGIEILKRERTAALIVIAIAILGLLADGYILVNKFILG